MCSATGTATQTFLLLLLLSLLQDRIASRRTRLYRCLENYGGDNGQKEAEMKGEILCSFPKGKGLYATTACMLSCHNVKPDEDQLRCFKVVCRVWDGRHFCEKPGMPHINWDQCDEFLDAGKVKFYGKSCQKQRNGTAPSPTVNN